MPLDEKDFARTIVELLKMIHDLQTTVIAMAVVLQGKDKEFEAEVGKQRARLLARAAPLIAQFERADAADLLELLKRFSGPAH